MTEKVRNFLNRLSVSSPDAAADLRRRLGHDGQGPRAMHNQGARPAAGDDMNDLLARDRRSLGLDDSTVQDGTADTMSEWRTAADVSAAIRRDRLALGLSV
mgnify:CR=1 FL=1